MTFDPALTIALKRLQDLLETVTSANQEFLQRSDRFAELAGLLDQRDLTLELLREHETATLNDLAADAPSATGKATAVTPVQDAANTSGEGSPRRLTEVLVQAHRQGRIAPQDWDSFTATVKRFESSNQDVEAFLNQEKARISTDLKAVRQGSTLLKGYAPPGGSDSCFIDKIK